MASPLLSSRLALLSSFASALSTSSSSLSAGEGALSTSNSAAPIRPRKTTAAAAASTRSFTRTVYVGGGCGVRDGVHRYTSNFNGAPVPVSRVPSSQTTTRRRASSTGHPALPSSPRSALVQKVTAHELDSILSEERTSPMIIDFYATWCGPCVVLAQELEQLAVEYGEDIRFLKVDTDEEHELASQMEIRGLPTMVFVSKDVDKLAIRTEGLLPTDAIRDIIEKEILVS